MRPKLRIIPALLFLGIFFFIPLGRILLLSLDTLPGLAPRSSFPPYLGEVILFTFVQAGASTLLTLLVGLPLAWLFARYDFPLKNILRALTAIPFMLPTLVVAAGFSALLGPRGWFTLGLNAPPLTGTFIAILLAHVFYNTTIVIRIVGDAWRGLDARLPAAAQTLGAPPAQVLWRVTLPLLRPAILAASLLVFLFDFTSYGVILLLGGPQFATIEVEIYLQAMHYLNLPAAALLSLIQLLFTLGLSALYSRYIARVTAQIRPAALSPALRRPKNISEAIFISALIIFCVAFFASPLLSVPLRSITRLEADRAGQSISTPTLTLDFYRELFINRRGSLFYVPPAQAALNSLGYASLTVALSLLLGFPAALALSRPGPLEKWIDPLLMLPLGASAVTLGLGYIVTFNFRLPSFAFSPSSFHLLTSPFLIPLAHTTIALPFVIRNLQAALATLPERTREAARILGASPFQVWMYVDFPIIRRAVISAAALAFTVSLGEFGAASLLARPDYPTLPTAIYAFLSQPGALNYGQAMAMATLLMLFTGAGIALIESLRPQGSEL